MMYLLGVLLIFLPIYGVKFPPNLYFLDVNRRFQAKCAIYWNFRIIETNKSITIKFCTVIKTTKYPLRMVQMCPKQIQDSVRLPSWKSKSRSTPTTDRLILMKFGAVMHLVPPDPTGRKSLRILKIQDGGSRHRDKSKNRNISTMDWPILTTFGRVMPLGPLDPISQ